MCFHFYPTGFCCQGSALNWVITLEDHVYSACLCIFLIHSPYSAYACSRWTALQSTANLYSVVRGLPADKWPGGEVQGESCQRQSALWCCSNLRSYGGRESERWGGPGNGERCPQCMYIYIYPKFFKRWKYHLSLWDRHSINLCENVLQQDVDTRHIWKWFVRKSCWKS